MDKQNIRRLLEDYSRKYVLLYNQFERHSKSGEDLVKLDEEYERRFKQLADNFMEEISGPSLRLIKKNTVDVYEYDENFYFEVVDENNYRSAWLYHKRSKWGYDYPKTYLCGAKIEDPERITDEYDIFLERVVNVIREKDSCGCDSIQTYYELYGGEEE